MTDRLSPASTDDAATSLVMGILNVTPDSFSDGGLWIDPEAAIHQGLELAAQGATIIDIGGESTRPGAPRCSAEEEQRRVLPVVKALADHGIDVSIDTMRAETAIQAVQSGASIVNDVSGGRADPDMLGAVAALDVDYVMMHWRGHSDVMSELARYTRVVDEVIEDMIRQRDIAVSKGVAPERIVLDPGIGFAKTAEHNWAILGSLPRFMGLGHRLLIGASRKRFLGELLSRPSPRDRDHASAAISGWCTQHGVWAVRTHSVAEHLDAIRVMGRLMEAASQAEGDR